MDTKEIFDRIEMLKDEMVGFLAEIVSVPAVGPLSGGDGEAEKASVIERYLRKFGLDEINRYDVLDDTVSSGYRPNIKVSYKGKGSGHRIVIITHMDVVPPGDIEEWDSEPFKVKVNDGRMIGRGVEDNGQALTASIFALRTIKDLDIRPVHDIAIFLVSDEEETNEKGMGHLVSEGLIGGDDIILVPDHGEPTGKLIELVEKSILWVRVTVKGRQCHASMPHLGNNAFRASMVLGSRIDRALHDRFDRKDETFDHPFSSFEPTKRETEASGINVLPGEDVFYFDCRLLPGVPIDDVILEIRRIADEVQKEAGVSIDIDPVLRETTLQPTLPDAEIVRMLSNAIIHTTGKTPYTGGIGGGTCAAILRNKGLEVAVWETIHNQAHAPNEYILIDNMVSDCKVLASLFTLDDQ
ncbi:MAG: M20 family metallo-hydrolase [Candidatus Thermoplasmatota archaeon]|nr:M20 family metallo-hydrolase [Candidatus Thermoplasmatota archaeon]